MLLHQKNEIVLSLLSIVMLDVNFRKSIISLGWIEIGFTLALRFRAELYWLMGIYSRYTVFSLFVKWQRIVMINT